ncbi:MAG: GAF domain-containing protein [Anaerolineaceae bacterium]|nr:MAG: GAF domain-containing protein [Anaerolineaceae bacterium]
MNLAFVLFLGGAVTIAWIYFWARSQEAPSRETDFFVDEDVTPPGAGSDDAVIVAHEHGRLLYLNPPARRMFKLNGGRANLEQVAQMAEPADHFLGLFAGEGQASFQFDQQWMEASSHRIEDTEQARIIVVMRPLAGNASNPDMLDMNRAMSIINEIGDTVNVTLGLEPALQAILTIIGKHITFDAAEISLWDEADEVLYQRGWAGDTTYLIELASAGGKYEAGEGITGWIAKNRRPVLLNTADERAAIPTKLPTEYQSFVGVPIILGERFIGTMEMANRQVGAFTAGDMALLQAIAKPAAVTIYNTDVYSGQAQRIRDIATFQQAVDVSQAQTGGTGQIYAMLNERVADLLSADMCGILLYDDERDGLVMQSPVHGLPDALVKNIFIPLTDDSPQHDIWTNQQYWLSNDVPDEPLVEALGLSPVVSLAGIKNTAWMPLSLGGERIGVIAVSNKRTEGGFSTPDVQNLSILAVQAAVVIENLRLFEREQRMDAELIGLQEITNAIGALSHEAEFYSDITERIAKLMDIEIAAILLHDPTTAQLVAQLPIYGVDAAIAADYRVDVPNGSVMLQLWEEERYWYSNRVPADTLFFAAGLDEINARMGIEKTMFGVMQASGRRIGLVQAANKTDGEDFSESDARLLMIFATQAAAIIENARLFREAQRSAEEAQSLRRVAELAGNVLTSQETFTPVLAEIAGLNNVEIVFINVVDGGNLVTFPRWVYGAQLSEPIYQDMYSPGFENSVVLSQRPFITDDAQDDERILESYRQIATRLSLRDCIVVPLVFGDRTLGEIGIANRRGTTALSRNDLEVMQAVAAQIAAALDRLLLYEATGENLSRRIEELDAVSRVSNELTTTLDLTQILQVIREESVRATKAQDCTIALIRPARQSEADLLETDYVVVQRLHLGDEIDGLTDVEVEAIGNRSAPVNVTDYELSTFKSEPSGARSALVVPIIYVEQIVGLIHLYHPDAGHFDDRASAFLMTMAVKASLAYGNAVRYSEQLERSENLRRRVDQLNRIFELGHMVQSNADPVSILEAIAYSVQQSVGFDSIVMLLLDEEAGILRRVAQAGMPIDQFEESRGSSISEAKLEELLRADFRISESYFFPVQRLREWYVEGIEALSTHYDGNRTLDMSDADSWHDGDLFIVQMVGPSGGLVGLMCLDRPYNNRRPDRGTVEVLEIFANQAASTIENTRLYLSSVASAEQEARLNDILEAVSGTLVIDEIVAAVVRGTLAMLSYDRMTFALRTAENEFYLSSVTMMSGRPQIGMEIAPDLGDGILNNSYAERRDYLIQSGDSEITEFDDVAAWYEEGERTTLVLPLVTGGQALGVMHIGSRNSDATPFREGRGLMRRMAQLVASAVQNARLFDQAVNLRTLNESVLESIQQGIMVLDRQNRVISINGFLVERYQWARRMTGQTIHDYLPGVADIIDESLQTTLTEATPTNITGQYIETEDGETITTNFYIYPLRYGDTTSGTVVLVEDVTERSRLEQAMESRANQLTALTEVSTRITSSLERDEVVTLAMEEMAWLIPHSRMSVWRRNGSFMVLERETSEAGAADKRFLFSDYDVIRRMVESQRVVAAGGGVELPETVPYGDFHSWMGVPLVNQGHVVGMMMLTDERDGLYDSPSDQNVAFAFASQVAIALANADLFEQTFDRTNELGTLLEAAQATSLTTDLASVFKTVVELMFSALEMDECAIMIWDEVDNLLEVQLEMNRGQDDTQVAQKGTTYDLADYPARLQALRQREVIVITRENDDIPYQNEIADMERTGDAARLLVPLVVSETSRGLIVLGARTGEIITQQKVRLARALGTQVAVAIENARLSAETTAHFEESLMINDLSRAISSTLNVEDMFDVVREQLPSVTGASEIYLALYDSKTEAITFPLAVSEGQPYDIAPRTLNDDEVSFVIRQRRPLNLGADYYSPDELRRSLGITNGEGDARSYLGVPLIAGDEVYGVLAVRDRQRTRAFTINEQRILTTVGSQLGAAIQNARLFRQVSRFADEMEREVAERTSELEEERDRLDTLYQITSELSRTLDMDVLMPIALSMVAKAIGAGDGVITQLDPITDQLYTRYMMNPNMMYSDADDAERSIHPAEHIAREAILDSEQSVVVNDLQAQAYWDTANIPNAALWRSAISVRLETSEELLGMMVLLSEVPDAFSESHARLIIAAANQVAASINNADLYKMIREQAERLGALLRAEQEEADKNKAILEGIADGVVLADTEGVILLFNNAAERIFRIPRSEAIGHQLSKVTGVYGATAESWAETLERKLRNPQEIDEYLDERVKLGERTISVHLSPVYTEDKFLGTVSVFRDITREVLADQSKAEFVANVSHEFRTPLTSIKGYNDLLLMGAFGELGDQQQMMLNTVRDNVTRLAALVEDVLNISKIDAGREKLTVQSVDMNSVVEQVLTHVRRQPKHQHKNFTVTFEAMDDVPIIQGDAEKLTQAVNNVVDNAFNYTEAGGTIGVEIEPDDERKILTIAISDTGVGVPEDFRESIWERFKRDDETALTLDVAGTGLGLSIVKKLVEMHRGRVWFESELGVGTTFYIALPYYQPEHIVTEEEGESD